MGIKSAIHYIALVSMIKLTAPASLWNKTAMTGLVVGAGYLTSPGDKMEVRGKMLPMNSADTSHRKMKSI
jgi:hypothetical protein